jgi:predicted HAD superfamily Cof-like phosphohydrolase
MTSKIQKQVKELMETLNLQLPNEIDPSPNKLNFDLLRSIVEEESKEFNDAMYLLEEICLEYENYNDHKLSQIDPNDREPLYLKWSKVIKEMCDVIIVIHNVSNAMGIDLEPFLDEVHLSNMKKIGGKKRADGKALKPEYWKEPNLIPLLLKQIERKKELIDK